MSAAAETGAEKAGSVEPRSPDAIPPCVAEVHDDEIGIAEWAMLGPHPGAYSGNAKPSSVAVAGVERSLLGRHGRLDEVLDTQLGVVVPLERLQILHQGCRHLDQVRIESSTDSKLDVLLTS